MASEELTYSNTGKDASPGQPTRGGTWRTALRPNVLDKYASFNTIFTWSTLNRDELNNPKTILTNPPHDIIAKSGGIGNQGRFTPFNSSGKVAADSVPLSQLDRFQTTLNAESIKLAGEANKILTRAHDIFFETVVIQGNNGANEERKLINLNKIDFTMTEPFGVTLFEKLQAAAFNNGYRDHIDCPFLLTIEFRGYDNRGNPLEVITARKIPFKVSTVAMEVNAGGTQYEVSTIVQPELAMTDRFMYTRGTGGMFTDAKQKISTFLDSRSATLKGTLAILAENLNEHQRVELKLGLRDEIGTLDQYVIDTADGVFQSVGGEANDADDARGPAKYKFTIRPNMSIAQVIQDIVLQTEEYRNINKIVDKYWKDLSRVQELEGQVSTKDLQEMMPEEMVPWFKIRTSIYNTEAFDRVTKQHAKIIHFRVIPWRVHIMNFAVPGLSAGNHWGQRVKKAYKYIYTGENNEILDLKLNYNYAYWQPTLFDGSRSDAASARKGNNLNLIDLARRYGNKGVDYPEKLLPLRNYPSSIKNEDPSTDDANSRTQVDGFMEYLTNPLGNMVNVEMTIMGDPAYIGQENVLPMGNVSLDQSGKIVTERAQGQTLQGGAPGALWDDRLGCFNFDQGECFVSLDFRFPTDISERQGVMDFKGLENVAFSGLYKVNKVTSTFAQGKFTQVLEMMRFDQQGKEVNVADQINIMNDFAQKAEDLKKGIWRDTKDNINRRIDEIYNSSQNSTGGGGA